MCELLFVVGMETSMLENSLETRFMGLVFTISLTVTTTKELGMKVVSKQGYCAYGFRTGDTKCGEWD